MTATDVYQFRPILNTDPPQIAELWNSQPPQRGLVHPVSPWVLERWLFSRPTFDPDGFIVATDDDADDLLGFVHVGFGPTDDERRLSAEMAVICMVMVRPELYDSPLPGKLIAAGEEHLRSRGAKVLYAGGIRPLNPFYLGLYGGSDLPGVLESDAVRLALYRAAGYEEIDRVWVMQRRLEGFRPRVNRTQILLRRQMQVHVSYDPASCSWWDACTTCGLDRMRFELTSRQGGEPAAVATFWEMEPFTACWGERTFGLLDLKVAPDCRRRGYASYLMGEALGRLREEGIERIEAQSMISNAAANRLYLSLGMEEVDQGVVLRRSANG